MYKIILNASIMTLNEYISIERGNRYRAAKAKREHTKKIEFLARMPHNFIVIDKKKDVLINWFVPNNRVDHDNIAFGAKFIFDGLKNAGVIVDDSPRYIGNIHNTFTVDKSRTYISCIIEFHDKISLCYD